MPEGRGGLILLTGYTAAPHRVPGTGSQYTFAEIVIIIIKQLKEGYFLPYLFATETTPQRQGPSLVQE